MLVAIAIPIFTSQLEKSRESTDLSNARAAYAEISAAILDDSLNKTNNTMTISSGATVAYAESITNGAGTATVTITTFPIKQTQEGWITSNPNVAGVAVTGSPLAPSATLTLTLTITTQNTRLTSVAFS